MTAYALWSLNCDGIEVGLVFCGAAPDCTGQNATEARKLAASKGWKRVRLYGNRLVDLCPDCFACTVAKLAK